jgi:hypothetical protein
VNVNITPATLTVSGLTANNKTYDGTTNATLNFTNAVLSGVYSGESVMLDPTQYVSYFVTRNAGNNIPVIVQSLGYSGADASNYIVANPTGLTANILLTGNENSAILLRNDIISVMQQSTTDLQLPILFDKADVNNDITLLKLDNHTKLAFVCESVSFAKGGGVCSDLSIVLIRSIHLDFNHYHSSSLMEQNSRGVGHRAVSHNDLSESTLNSMLQTNDEDIINTAIHIDLENLLAEIKSSRDRQGSPSYILSSR